MRCFVCGKRHEAECCPVCQFPVLRFPGDPEEGLRAVQPTIDSYRAQFLAGVRVELLTYQWKEEGDHLAMTRSSLLLGTGDALLRGEQWASQPFARIPDAPTLEVEVSVSWQGQSATHRLTLPNLPQAELQRVGAVLDRELRLQLLLRNGSGRTASEQTPLFP